MNVGQAESNPPATTTSTMRIVLNLQTFSCILFRVTPGIIPKITHFGY